MKMMSRNLQDSYQSDLKSIWLLEFIILFLVVLFSKYFFTTVSSNIFDAIEGIGLDYYWSYGIRSGWFILFLDSVRDYKFTLSYDCRYYALSFCICGLPIKDTVRES
jgi:hypothetical protein